MRVAGALSLSCDIYSWLRAGPKLVVSAWLVLALSSGSSAAQSPKYCKKLTPAPSSNYPYEDRQGRCEGALDRDNAGATSLTLVSLTKTTAAQSVGTANGGKMQVTWGTAAAPAELQGHQLSMEGFMTKGSLHYRMDTLLAFNSASYVWPMDVLTGLQLSPEEVLLTASVAPTSGDPIYVPVQIGQMSTPPTHYRLKLVPTADVNRLSYVLETAATSKMVGTRVFAPNDFRSASAPFALDVPFGPLSPGTYRIRINARKEENGKSTNHQTNVTVFHHG